MVLLATAKGMAGKEEPYQHHQESAAADVRKAWQGVI
jgi:hypothetical protein